MRRFWSMSVFVLGCAMAGSGTASATEPAAVSERQEVVVARLTVEVKRADEAAATLIQVANAAGGHLVELSDTEVTVAVPATALDPIVAKAASLGVLLERGLVREDRTASIAGLEAQLTSKREILGRMRAFLADADAEGTVQVERAMSALVEEMETVAGQLRVERDRAASARLVVSFRIAQRDRVVYVRSPYGWLNSVDLDRFLGEY